MKGKEIGNEKGEAMNKRERKKKKQSMQKSEVGGKY